MRSKSATENSVHLEKLANEPLEFQLGVWLDWMWDRPASPDKEDVLNAVAVLHSRLKKSPEEESIILRFISELNAYLMEYWPAETK